MKCGIFPHTERPWLDPSCPVVSFGQIETRAITIGIESGEHDCRTVAYDRVGVSRIAPVVREAGKIAQAHRYV